jgi:hypothetical protein
MIARNPAIWAGALDGDPASKGRAGVVFDGELDHLRMLRAMDAGEQGEGHIDAGRHARGGRAAARAVGHRPGVGGHEHGVMAGHTGEHLEWPDDVQASEPRIEDERDLHGSVRPLAGTLGAGRLLRFRDGQRHPPVGRRDRGGPEALAL